jgi:flagellar biosynthesis/type III secretory pathway M-ring protein FliF/YscJ
MSKFNLKQKLVIAGIVVVIVVLAIAVIVSR